MTAEEIVRTLKVDDDRAGVHPLSQRRRAMLEAELWLELKRSGVAKPGTLPPVVLASLVGSSKVSVEVRRALWLAGAEAQPLWTRVDEGMPLGTAARLLSESRRVEGGVEAVLRAYDRRGYEMTGSDGKRYRRGRAKPKGRRSWDRIRDLVLGNAREELGEVGSADAERLSRQLDAELREVLREHRARVARLKVKQVGGVGQLLQMPNAGLRRACKELGVPVPRPGAPVDLDAARKRKRELVKRYHPDVTGSDESRPAYDAVLAAFAVLEGYEESRGANHGAEGREGGGEVAGG